MRHPACEEIHTELPCLYRIRTLSTMFPSYRRNKSISFRPVSTAAALPSVPERYHILPQAFLKFHRQVRHLSSKRSASFTCSHSYISFARNGFFSETFQLFCNSSYSYARISFFILILSFFIFRILPFHPFARPAISSFFSAFRHFQTSFFRNRAIKIRRFYELPKKLVQPFSVTLSLNSRQRSSLISSA